MPWLSICIETDCHHADALADALLESGALSASIEDADAGTERETPQFGEPGSVTTPGWERSRVVALLAEGTDPDELLAACAAYPGATNARRITFEYSLVHGVNDTEEDILELTSLLKHRNCHVNLIPVNPVREKNFRRVAVFAARPGEVDLLSLLDLLPDREWYFPLVHEGRRLSFHRVCHHGEIGRAHV